MSIKQARNRSIEREEAILSAATELFSLNGFDAVSTRRIASEAGVSEGTLFNYFGSKNELLLAVLTRFYQDMTEKAQAGVSKIMNSHERLLFVAQNHLDALAANQALMLRLLHQYLSIDLNFYAHYEETPIRALNYRYTRVFDQVVKEAIQRGEISADLDLPAYRDLFYGGLEYGMRSLLVKKPKKTEPYITALVDPIWFSMCREDSAAKPDHAQRLEAACDRLEQLLDNNQRPSD
jgi:AcrR family transcriptional regulator